MSRLGREFLFVLLLAVGLIAAAFVVPTSDPVADAVPKGQTTYHASTGRAFATRTPSSSSYFARRAAGLNP